MGYANEQFEVEYTLDSLVELADISNDDDHTPWEAFNDEIDIWALRALVANGFGDY
jgi:hypothetical protein